MNEGHKLNLIVVICHDMGQHLACYGAADVRTPHLDALLPRACL